MKKVLGRISSVESLGLLDGPGIRFVIFLQGCKLRCKYCHNPETWDINGKAENISPEELLKKIARFKNYFGSDGGVTFSGGEPLLQPEFLTECLKLCKQENIHTCIDTAGVGFGEYDEILDYVDLVILDIKAVDGSEYKTLTGQDIKYFNQFLTAVQRKNKKLWLRQVIVPNMNDDRAHIIALCNFVKQIKNVEKVELLPYRTIGVHKYKDLNIPYRLEGVPELSEEKLNELNTILKQNL